MLGLMGCDKEKPDYETFKIMFNRLAVNEEKACLIGLTHNGRLVTKEKHASNIMLLSKIYELAGVSFDDCQMRLKTFLYDLRDDLAVQHSTIKEVCRVKKQIPIHYELNVGKVSDTLKMIDKVETTLRQIKLIEDEKQKNEMLANMVTKPLIKAVDHLEEKVASLTKSVNYLALRCGNLSQSVNEIPKALKEFTTKLTESS